MLKVLAADIGGTNSRFATFLLPDGGQAKLLTQTVLESRASKSFGELMSVLRTSEFGADMDDVNCFVIAITGPVQGGTYCRSVNLPWDVDLKRDKDVLPLCPAWLINDFLAQAFATLSPAGATVEQVQAGDKRSGEVVSVIGAGTGLGKAFLVPDHSGHYIGCSSEGGHENFAPETDEDIELMKFGCRRFDSPYVVWDDITSGRGLSLMHEFLYQERLAPHEVAAKFSSAPKTVDLFSRTYGRLCRNFALETLPYGGLYIAGGIAARNPQIVLSDVFRDAFVASKSYSELLKKIPVFLFDDGDSGLWGAAWYGRERILSRNP